MIARKEGGAFLSMSKEFNLYIGIMICGSIIMAWYFITNKIEKNVRYLLISIVVIINIIKLIQLRQWGLAGVFWLVISAAFCFSERFPKSTTTLQKVKERRKRITFWEDYLFVVGLIMIGIEEWMRALISSITYN